MQVQTTIHRLSVPGGKKSRRGFSALELLIVLIIMSIVAVLGIDSISHFEATQRADRTSRELLSFFRYARHLAMTTGNQAKVQLDTTNQTFAVYLQSNGTTWDATPYTQAMASGGTMLMNLKTERELAGTTMAVTPAANTSFVYQSLGSFTSTGTITCTYGSYSKTLTVASVGDPQIN